MSDNLATIRAILHLNEEDAARVLFLTHWVDQQVAIREFGYPKDNVIPPPMAERLADLDYVASLHAQAREDDEVGPRVVDAIQARLRALEAG